VSSRSIVYGVALGLAYQWSRFLRRHPDSAPKWFVPFGNDDGSGFAAFIGSSGAGAAGSGGGGAAAAGGGGSGAA
jgi:hypothetical protein